MNTTNIAGDVDYAAHGQGYGRQRRTDPRLAAWVHAALGDARSVVNVGAGSGSYEPLDRHVLPIEPSASMRAQRPRHLAPAVDGVAEKLPLDDQSVDAAMALVTVHQWPDLARGLHELRRVTRGPIVLLTFDPDALDRWWMADYCPEMLAVERRRFPTIATLAETLGGACEVHPMAIPHDCVDGFSEAFFARPEAFLDPAVRRSQSAWSFVPDDVQARFVARLGADLAAGDWDRRHAPWRRRPFFEGSLRGIVSRPPRRSAQGQP